MNFQNNFQKDEYYARQGLLILQELYPNTFKYKIEFTQGEYDPYDGMFFIIDTNTQSIVKRVWIELKIRKTAYDSYLLETKKMNSLIKLRKDMFFTEDEVTLLYINFTPEETIIYNLDKVKNLPTEKKVMNKCTVISRTNKIEKSVIMLRKEDGKVLNYILNENQIDNRNKVNNIVDTKSKEMKNDLFKTLFGG
jgi:hypothetical protein